MKRSNLKLAEKEPTPEEKLAKDQEAFDEWKEAQKAKSEIPALYWECGVSKCAEHVIGPLKVLSRILVEKIEEAEDFMSKTDDYISAHDEQHRLLCYRRGEVVLTNRFPGLTKQEVHKILSEIIGWVGGAQ
jgi:hypothetical protein